MLLYKSIIYIPPGSAYNSYNSLQYKLMSILFCDHIYCCNTVYFIKKAQGRPTHSFLQNY